MTMNNKYLLKLWPASVVRVTFHAPHSHIGLAGLQVDILYCPSVFRLFLWQSIKILPPRFTDFRHILQIIIILSKRYSP